MASSANHKWAFRPKFRKGAFGWRSDLPIKRVKEAVSEIKKVARKDPVVAAEGAVIFLEKVSNALEHVDSSSGAIGNAVNNAVDVLAGIIAKAPLDEKTREKYLERLFQAAQDDDIPYIESLPEYWGDMCVEKELASKWADRLKKGVRHIFQFGGYSCSIPACLSSMLKAERYEEILDLIKLSRHQSWHEREWGVKALAALDRVDEAICFANDSRGLYSSNVSISSTCEEILLNNNRADEAYSKYAIEANRRGTYLATFRAIVKKYPHKKKEDILKDLVKSTPGKEGKWFAAAKSAGMYSLAKELAKSSPCNPATLTRAARDFATKEPDFATEAGLAAIHWLIEGYGYDVTALDVFRACDTALETARNAGKAEEAINVVKKMMLESPAGNKFVTGHIEDWFRLRKDENCESLR